MRVGLVLEQFDPRRGGLEQWTTQFATELIARGHEVHVVARDFGERSRAMPIIPHKLEGCGAGVGFAVAAREKLLQLGPDVIHDMGSGWYCDILHPHGGSLAGIAEWKPLMLPRWLRPLKTTVDSMLPRYRNFRRIAARQYADDGRLVIALSRMVADNFQRLHGVRSEQIRLVYNGVDTERFSPERRNEYRRSVRRWLGISEDTLLLLIVTHNYRLKGVPSLMKAVQRLSGGGRPIHLAVVGGKPSARFRMAASRMGIGRNVTFVGAVDDTVPYYAAADAYAHPTLYDSCSLVVLEALASGLPVITSRNNGASELISEGREGFVLPAPDDIDILTERIEALTDPVVHRGMGRSARELALQHTLERNVDQILGVYEEVVANRDKTARSSTLFTRVSVEEQGAYSRSILTRPRTDVSVGRRVAFETQSGPIPRRADDPAMQIGLAIEQFDPQRGGAENWTYQFARQLLAEGHEVHVVARDFSGPGAELPVFKHELQDADSRLGFAATAEKQLRELNLDVVHDMGGGWYCNVFESHDGSRLAQWEEKLRMLPAWARPLKRMMIRTLPRYHRFRKLFGRQLGDSGHLVIALSKMVAKDFEQLHGVPPERIRLIYNGVDTERFSPDNRTLHGQAVRRRLSVADDETLFLFMGHDFHRKGLATVLRSMQRLLQRGYPARLAVVGGHRKLRRYQRLASRMGVAEAVTFLGTVKDPAPYYAASDAYVLPTFYDPCSLGVLEAAASGLPSITTRRNGASELMSHGTEGFLLSDPAADQELAQYMEQLFDARLRARMGEAARKLALEHTIEENCRSIVEVYREIVARRGRRLVDFPEVENCIK